MATYDIGGKSYTIDDSLPKAEVRKILEELTSQKSAVSAASKKSTDRDVGLKDYGRAALQGLTFGFGDEIVAGARSLGDQTYEEALVDERGQLPAVREESPL